MTPKQQKPKPIWKETFSEESAKYSGNRKHRRQIVKQIKKCKQ